LDEAAVEGCGKCIVRVCHALKRSGAGSKELDEPHSS